MTAFNGFYFGVGGERPGARAVLRAAVIAFAAGIRVFVGGLHPASEAKSLRARPSGEVLVGDGPYLKTREHVGGFWVLEVANLEEAIEWGRRATIACRAPVEVRRFH